MARKYKTGDVLRLKSGGPKLTVKEYAEQLGEGLEVKEHLRVICQWFAGSKSEQAGFPEDSLERVEPDQK